MRKTLISRSFIIIFILALAVLPVALFFLPNHVDGSLAQDNHKLAMLQQMELSQTPTSSPSPTPTTKVPPPLPSHTGTQQPVSVTPTKTKTLIASVIQAENVVNWTTYNSGEIVAKTFGFTYPSSWQVDYRDSSNESNTSQFRFTQSSGTQVMNIHVYTAAQSPEAFITANYKGKLVAEPYGTFGSVVVYRLSPVATLAANDPVSINFGTRGLILGKEHAYTVSFDANPDHALINLIEQVIWPSFSFK